MPLLYGEGEVKAFQRLREAINKPLKEQKLVLSRLRFAENAIYYQGTRVELLRRIEIWAGDLHSEGVFWLNGMAAQKFDDKVDLGATFFFKRGRVPSFALHVQKAIKDDPNPKKYSKAVIVIDALDECDRERDIGIIIRLLPQFFLTSRPELPIRLGFKDISGSYKGLALHEIEESVIKEDISTFLEYDLAMIRNNYNKPVLPKRQLPTDWPGERNVQILVDMATPLFIFAATVCRFIRDRRCGRPNEQLAKVLKYQTSSQASKLNTTYLPVLNQLLFGLTTSEKRSVLENFQQVIGSIIIFISPLSANSLDRLLEVDKGTVEDRTDLLHSVLSIPSCPNHPIQLFHLSFRDFLVNDEKRETNPFWVNETQAHQRMSEQCIRLMVSSLKQDLCGLKGPGTLVIEVERSWVNRCISPELQYACLYWVQHLQKSGSQAYNGDKANQFLQAHLLH
ncbi:hypothetical protein F5882DRAFT_430132 [Hyaloscypha sp. PMI_1271]|nr:hypothetical protein F5882DRAFT_430132 [Hyaloscypha sp. PMI_1271]